MDTHMVIGDRRGVVGLLAIVLLVGFAYAIYSRVVSSKRLAGNFTLETKDAQIDKAVINNTSVYRVKLFTAPAVVTILTEGPSVVVSGATFKATIGLDSHGSFRDYSMEKAQGYFYADMDGDGDADLRARSDFSEETREVRIGGVWTHAPNWRVSIGGSNYVVRWNHKWELHPESSILGGNSTHRTK